MGELFSFYYFQKLFKMCFYFPRDGKKHVFQCHINLHSNSGSPLTNWVNSGKLLNLSEHYFLTGTTGNRTTTCLVSFNPTESHSTAFDT